MQVSSENVQYRFDFLKYRYILFSCSIALLLSGVVGYFVNNGFQYNIDFTGGVELRISFENTLDGAQVRHAMSEKGWKDAIVQNVGSTGKEFLIRIATLDEELEKKIKSALIGGIKNNKVTIDNVQFVGPETGRDTTKNALIAVLLSLVILLLYIAVRFDFRYGVGAIAALVHDVLVILVYLVVTGEPISLHVLAAILAVLGYSINDTIVIFSKIRANFAKFKGVSEYDLANLGINQTLKRTLLTSISTFIAVGTVFLLGGEALRGLSVVMLLGIVFGTYSSMYIASPIALMIKK